MEFAPLRLEDRPRVGAALAADPPEISELTFTNLWVWGGKRRVFLAELDGGLAFRCEERGRSFFLPPVGARDPAAAALALLAHARAAGRPAPLERAPRALAERLRERGLAPVADRDNFDYVYAVRDLAELGGRRFDGKRNQIRALEAAHRVAYRPLDAGLAAACLALAEDWCDLRACALDPGLDAERAAIAACLRSWDALGLLGGGILVDGRLRAFAIAEALAPDTAVVHFEKADPAVRGLYQLIASALCREALAGFALVNREQDLGLPGLRRAKEGWHPVRLVEKFTVAG